MAREIAEQVKHQDMQARLGEGFAFAYDAVNVVRLDDKRGKGLRYLEDWTSAPCNDPVREPGKLGGVAQPLFIQDNDLLANQVLAAP